ncbi:unnamed protein product [Cuscuta epithymum]|uniref:Reverse transcriptase domain-containing protein n=1 Tax=Cuscuta epithymum TaxID=186058 RepID=A0AAV0E2X9_9ASTE|nr:unnamed protein product [Cuscuta epithymum]
MIRKQEGLGNIVGISVARGAPRVSHLFFADDSYLFFRARDEECQTVKNLLQSYEEVSGQKVNHQKSSVLFSPNLGGDSRTRVSSFLGVSSEETNPRYLGLQALVGRKKMDILGYLLERILKRIQSWNNRFLSKAGREIMLKTIIQAMPTYAMNVFLLPKELCSEIEGIMNGYWWRGSDLSRRGLRWKSWQSLCYPKQKGGLGFQSLREFNIAMLGKVNKPGGLLKALTR